ncbi:MAG: HD domain-containing protein [Eubacteriales bacterium]|nr:HD domain-containing protein [Eubacteriales bacterium]
MIDRSLLRDSFKKYINRFNAEDERISLKIRHTAFVANNSDHLSETLELTEDDKDLAWAIAMLHDLGRFEQVAANGSFIDSVSSDHADAGVDYLFGKGKISDFIPQGTLSDNDLNCIELAITYHNKHLLPPQLSDRQRLFCNIIRDADKLDIFRVCVENTFEVAHEYPPETVAESAVSKEVLECFERFETLDYSRRKYPADIFLGHIAMCFGLYFPQSRKLAAEQGYIMRMADFTFSNPDSQEEYVYMKERLEAFLNSCM